MNTFDAIKAMVIATGVPVVDGSSGEGKVKRFAVVNNANREIVNFVNLRQGADWSPPEGHSAYEAPDDFTGDIGWREVNGQWVPPNSSEA